MRVCVGLLQVYLRSHMGFRQDIMRPAHHAGCFEQFKMSGMLIQVTARSPVMAVTVISPGSSPRQCYCSLRSDVALCKSVYHNVLAETHVRPEIYL